jgi:hypothetical protein
MSTTPRYLNIASNLKQDLSRFAEKIGYADTTKNYKSRPTPNVINGIHSATNPPWDQQNREHTKAKMYNTTQNEHIGKDAYKVDPYSIKPSAIIPKRRPLSIPSKLELKAHTLTLRL